MDEQDTPVDDERLKRGFYGRRAGKGLRGRQAELMGDYDEHPLTLSIAGPCPQDLRTLFPTKVSSVWLESGFGGGCLLYTSPSPRDRTRSRMPSSA